MIKHIIDSRYPGIAGLIVTSSPRILHSILSQAINLAVANISDAEPELLQLISCLDEAPARETVSRIKKYVTWADEQYIERGQSGHNNPRSLNFFNKARLANALMCVSEARTSANYADAFYELSVIGNGRSIIEFVSAELEGHK